MRRGGQDKKKCPCMFQACIALLLQNWRQKQVLPIHYSEPFVMRHQFIEVDRMSILKELFSMNRFMCYVSQMERKWRCCGQWVWYLVQWGWFQHIMRAFNCSEILQAGFPAYVHKWPVPRKLKPATFTTTFCCCWSPSCANKIYCELMNTCLINQARSVRFSMWMCLSPWSMDAMPTYA